MDEKPLMEAVAGFREALGITQVEFGVKIGKSYSTIQRYETREAPPAIELAKLALFARKTGHPTFAAIFKAAALKDVSPEIIQLIREADDNEQIRQKAPEKGAQHRRKTGT